LAIRHDELETNILAG